MQKLTKEELEKIYTDNTNKKACEILGVSECTLLKYVRNAGIAIKGRGTKNKIEVVG